ncbi:Aste57867_20694 [Aphanomyces stellatus]|uniref:Aste57867_20694 protein n=1 Tax=Aphanomyces stellatus TaxID=120398 RepID=A0A485LHL6_9STRA|nr:hypothetical protein As57867_020626 [Aphanomyces stellatus]VFT97374.1 Aste57867_20694 [Aphanomyces stellatus]
MEKRRRVTDGRNVLLMPDVIRVVSSFQDGLYPDMHPLANVEIPTLHTRQCRANYDDWLTKDGLAAAPMDDLHKLFRAWLDKHGTSRLPLLFTCLPRMVGASVRDAIWFNDLALLRTLDSLVDLTTLTDKLVDIAAWKNHFEILQYLDDEIAHAGVTSDAMEWACDHGNLDMLQYLHRRGRDPCTQEGLYVAFEKAHLDVATYLLEHGLAEKHDTCQESLAHVAGIGNVDAVKRMVALGATLDRDSMDAAAGNGHLEMVRYLHANNSAAGCSYEAIQMSATHGHAAVLDFLLDKFPNVRIKPDMCLAFRGDVVNLFEHAIDGAAGAGHLAIVQRLHEVLPGPDGCSTDAMDNAAAHGHLDVVEWLHTHRSEGCTQKAIDAAAANNHRDVVTWLQTHRHMTCSPEAMNGAAEHGHLEMVEWLHGQPHTGCTYKALDMAAANGHLDVLRFLHAHVCDQLSEHAMDGAVSKGHLHVVRWLHEHRKRAGASPDILDKATGNVPMTKWILANRHEGCPRCARKVAEKECHVVTAAVLRAVPRSYERECLFCCDLEDDDFYAVKHGPCWCALSKGGSAEFAQADVYEDDDDSMWDELEQANYMDEDGSDEDEDDEDEDGE